MMERVLLGTDAFERYRAYRPRPVEREIVDIPLEEHLYSDRVHIGWEVLVSIGIEEISLVRVLSYGDAEGRELCVCDESVQIPVEVFLSPRFPPK